MEPFNLVVFGITSNLAQLKIIPALYDLEAKNLLSEKTKIVGIGRKDIYIADFVTSTLDTPNRHHQHQIDPSVLSKLANKFVYLKEDINDQSGDVYKKISVLNGNNLYYLATYPDLYKTIFDNLKKYGLNRSGNSWAKIMIEKPIGHDQKSAQNLNNLFAEYFEDENIFRVDHYLGKEDLQKVFSENIDPAGIDNIQLSVLEDFGIGKRGVYYDATGALSDMGQNHFMQMLCAVAKKDTSVKAREEVINALVPEPDSLVLGQYEGYLSEEQIKTHSLTDTFFALRTHLLEGDFKDIPIYMRSGKYLRKNEVKISVVYKDKKIMSWIIESTGVGKNYDPYEKLILEAVKGNSQFFNSAKEVENSWKFIDAYAKQDTSKVVVYRKRTDGPYTAYELIKKDGRSWV